MLTIRSEILNFNNRVFSLKITKNINNFNIDLRINLYFNLVEISYIEIVGNIIKVLSLSIFIEDEYRGIGLSKKLFEYLLSNFRETMLKDFNYTNETINHILLHIDTDASWANNNSFWDYVGMNPSRYEYRKIGGKLFYEGYEKDIRINDLMNFVR